MIGARRRDRVRGGSPSLEPITDGKRMGLFVMTRGRGRRADRREALQVLADGDGIGWFDHDGQVDGGRGHGPARNGHGYRFQPELYGKPMALSAWRLAVSRLISILAVACGVWYAQWRFFTVRGTGSVGAAFFATEVANVVAVAFTAFLFWRVRWRRGPGLPPSGTLDVFITVCGEPAELVEETLKAALAIHYPHQTYLLNDGRIAGKPNWWEIDELGLRYGITCFTRATGARGKASNLNYALDRTNGEFVATIDADHRARPEFAEETLGYFMRRSDEGARRSRGRRGVGFVCTAQHFEGDAADVLNNRELLFYRYMLPAKDADNAAHSCGNGTIYRRTALEGIGGFSEWNLVEDVHTSYRLHAQGWRSVYHPRPVTTGLAPQTGSALAKQRLRWATDGLRMFLWDSPILKRGLTFRQRLHYLHTTGFYLIACTQLFFLVSPALYLLWGIRLMRVDSINAYVGHAVPYFASLFLLLFAYGGIRGGLRTMQSVLYMAPVFVIALFRALSRVRFAPTVSEKSRSSRISPLVLPQQALMALLALAVVSAFRQWAEGNAIAAVWAGWMAFSLSLLVTAVTPRARLTRLLRIPVQTALLVAMGVLVLPLALGTTPLGLGARGWSYESYFRPNAVQLVGPLTLAAPQSGAYVGFFSPPVLSSSARQVATWNRLHGGRASIVHWYQQWFNGEIRFRKDWMQWVARQGAVPMISWEPWAKPANEVHDPVQPEVRLAFIASGRYDAYIRSWARGVAAYKKPLLLRFMHEMNGNWYPWSLDTNGNSPAKFIRAWRHVHGIFESEGATNVSWVWSIASFTGLRGDNRDLASFYPGDRFVDWVSISGFNWGNVRFWNRWHSFEEVFRTTYDALTRLHKPVMISEISTVAIGGDSGQWIREAMDELRSSYPRVKAVVWFDSLYPGNVDFRLQGLSSAAFRSAVDGSPYWRTRPVIRPAPGASAPPPLPSARG